MEAMVRERESKAIVAFYHGVTKISDVFTDEGLYAKQIEMVDGTTATFNMIDFEVYKSAWIRA